MLQQSLAVALICVGGGVLYVVIECSFLIRPYWRIILFEHGRTILLFLAVLFINVTCAIYLVARWAQMAETGRKLAHVEKELLTGDSISEELAGRLREAR